MAKSNGPVAPGTTFKRRAPSLILPDRRIHRQSMGQSSQMQQGHFGLGFVSPGGAALATWNPADRSTANTWSFTNGDLTIQPTSGTGGFAFALARGSKAIVGKKYFTFKKDAGGSNGVAIGVANGSFNINDTTNYPNDVNSASMRSGGDAFSNGSSLFSGTSWNDTTSWVGVAIDEPNKRVAWSVNGVWQNSANPGAGTGMSSISHITGSLYPVVGLVDVTTSIVTANFGGSAFPYAAPSGYTPI